MSSTRGRSSWYIIITRIVESLKPKNLMRKGRHVGNDYLGNSYYEIEADPSRGKRTPVRWFKSRTLEQWDQGLPPEWNAWLRLRRTVPPTDEEIEYNLRIEAKKKAFGQLESGTDPKPVKKHSYSSFPTYEEYEESPGYKRQHKDNDNK